MKNKINLASEEDFERLKIKYSKLALDKTNKKITFIESLTYTKGKWAGKQFKLLPWQKDMVIKIFGTLRENGKRQYRMVYCEVAKKNGKCLFIDTEIPTLNGWKKIKDIKVGDKLFDEKGNICNVTAVSSILYGHDCYEVFFSDDTKIIADGEHLWQTTCRTSRGKKLLWTTKQIKERLYLNYRGSAGWNHSIKIADILQIKEDINLPIPPYTLGAWLGDGSSYDSRFTCSDIDKQILEEIDKEGINHKRLKDYKNRCGAYILGTFGRNSSMRKESLRYKLRVNNLIKKNKHIPKIYLRASIKQRISLLQGLMDTDGYCSKNGQCEFTTINPRLKDDFIELVRTLCLKPKLLIEESYLYNKYCGKKYRIFFFPYKNFPVFRLQRKLQYQKEKINKKNRSQNKHVIAINPIESVPVVCIAVDSESNLFLAGDGLTATHNTELSAAIDLAMLCADGENNPEVFLCACDKNQASQIYVPASIMVKNNTILSKKILTRKSLKRLIYPKNNGVFQVLSSDVKSKHGSSPSCVTFDEFHAQPNDELWRVMTSGTDYAREQQLIIIITTAGIWDINSVWWRVREKAKLINGQIERGEKPNDESFLPILYIADPEKDKPEDEKVWIKTNPSLGYIFTIDKIREDFEKVKNNPVEYQDFLRYRLNIPIKQVYRWMPMDKWDKCKGVIDLEFLRGRTCVGGLDLAKRIDLNALTLIFPPIEKDEPHRIITKFYCPEEGILKRSKTDKVRYDIWESQGHIKATPGSGTDYEFIKKDILDFSKMFKLQNIAYDNWNASQFKDEIMEELNPSADEDGFQMIEFRQGGKSYNEPMRSFLSYVNDLKILHDGNPVLRWNWDNFVVRKDANENLSPDKEHSTERIDGAVSNVMAWRRAIFFDKKEESIYEKEDVLMYL